MKYLIAIDSDGTLRHSDGTISEVTKKAISRLVENGHCVVICTARPRYYTKKIAEEVGASPYLISSNGSEIYDNNKDKIIFALYITTSQCKKLYNYAKYRNLRIVFVTEDKEYVTNFTRNENQILLDNSNIEELLSIKIKQVMIIGTEKRKILAFRKKVEEEFEVDILDSSNNQKDEIWFSVGSSDSSKGNAVIKLSKYLGISLKNTIAIGNDYNDLSMFDVCEVSAAVDNSNDDIKTHADIVIKSNDADGVAEYLDTIN